MTSEPGLNQQATPVLVLRGLVLLPHQVTPLTVGRPKSVAALKAVMARSHDTGSPPVVLAAFLKNAQAEDPTPGDLRVVATLANVIQLHPRPDDSVAVLLQGAQRVHLSNVALHEDHLQALQSAVAQPLNDAAAVMNLRTSLLASFGEYIRATQSVGVEIENTVNQVTDASELADTLAPYLNLDEAQLQTFLETPSALSRLEYLSQTLRERSTSPR